jgi:hypothetical protein
MQFPVRALLASAAAAVAAAGLASPALADGQIDASTLVSTSHGTFRGVPYERHEAMFEGSPQDPAQGSGLLLFDWLVASTIPTAVGQEQADARYTLADDFLFGLGASYATVRCDPEGIGTSSPIPDATRPWSDGLLDTTGEFITSAGDEFDIVVDYVKALKTDPVAVDLTGPIHRRAAFGYSAGGFRLRGLLRLQMGTGLFDFSLVGGTGNGYSHPSGNKIGFSNAEKAPLSGSGLEIDCQSEFDVIALGAHKTRHEESNYRAYQIAGASHIRNIDVTEFGLPDADTADPLDWVPFLRALFVAGNAWCDGIEPPPSIWLGAPNDPKIARDAKGNALVRYVGGKSVSTTSYRMPEVAVGENRYIPIDPSYDDGSLLGFLRMSAGGHVDLTGTFTSHAAYVSDVTSSARELQAQGYLTESDADAIIERAIDSDIGN